VLLANSFKDKYSRYNSLMYFYEEEKNVNTQTVGIFIFMDYFNKFVEEVSIGLIAVVTMFCTNVIAQILLHDEDLIAVLTVRQKHLLVGEAKIHLSG